MITKNRLVLLVNSTKTLEFTRKFEGISVITDIADVEKVWSKNKTPVILGKGKKIELAEIPVITVPDGICDVEAPQKFISFCAQNGFESGEFVTGEIFNTSEDRCFLCEIANIKGFDSLKKYNRFIDEKDCIIYDAPHFYVISELGAIKPGFLMICPKGHYLSIANCPEGYMAEYNQVCQDLEILLKGAYGEDKVVTFFEHGSDPSGKSKHKRSVVHAHTHVVVDFTLKPKYLEMVAMRKIDNIIEAKKGSYFSYQEGADGELWIVTDPEVYVQRQYPRQIMAEEMGLAPGQYNWRNVEFSENIHSTLYKIYSWLQENYDNLPERIQKRTKSFIDGYSLRGE